MARNPSGNEPLYRRVANSIEQQIGHGVLRVGDKVPSVRAFSRHHQISISTALQAYFWLEHRGFIEPRPRGGYLLWIELPKRVDAFRVYKEALQKNVSIMPGTIFSPSGRFENHIRISCNHPWSDKMDLAIETLGRICKAVL